jgi:hypothetical protein
MRLGADPELFLISRKTNNFKSVIGHIGANKWNPKQVDNLPEGFTLQEDNVALELGIPPAVSADEFVRNIRTAMLAGLRAIPETRFSKMSCTIFPKEEMNDPAAHIFGCEPDFNAWTGQENIKPEPPHPLMRSAGGHVHIETKLDKQSVIRACDLFLGVPSVLMDKTGGERRNIYGKAGAYRPKPYGVEYRTLSNFWIFQPKLTRWVWHSVERALMAVQTDMGMVDFFRDEIQDAINKGNLEDAKFLVEQFDLEVVV